MCIFCDIAAHTIPAHIVYEDAYVIAILDQSQVTKGHTLVMPRQHYDNLIACSKEDYLRVMNCVQELSSTLKSKLNAQGINVLCNTGEIAGQSVLHFHVHLIPRYSLQDAFHPTFNKSSELNLKQVLQEVKE